MSRQRAMVVVPPGMAGTVDVSVDVFGQGATLPSSYTYVATPIVTAITPGRGATAGGTAVTVQGDGFIDGAGLRPPPRLAARRWSRRGSWTRTPSPCDAAGSGRGGRAGHPSARRLLDGFEYVAPPVVTGLAPAWGPRTGGTALMVSGDHFVDVQAVSVGGAALAAGRWTRAPRSTGPRRRVLGPADVTVSTALRHRHRPAGLRL